MNFRCRRFGTVISLTKISGDNGDSRLKLHITFRQEPPKRIRTQKRNIYNIFCFSCNWEAITGLSPDHKSRPLQGRRIEIPKNRNTNNHTNTFCLMSNSCCAERKTSSTEGSSLSCIKIITAHKFIKADKVAEFIEFTRDIIAKSRAEEGCISYTLYQDPSDPTKFMFFEQWKDQAAIDYHFSTEHFKLSGSRGEEFDAAPSVITIYDACPAK